MGQCSKCGTPICGHRGLCIGCFKAEYPDCPKCKGKGWYWRKGTGRDRRVEFRITCTTCEGRGVCKRGTPITED